MAPVCLGGEELGTQRVNEGKESWCFCRRWLAVVLKALR